MAPFTFGSISFTVIVLDLYVAICLVLVDHYAQCCVEFDLFVEQEGGYNSHVFTPLKIRVTLPSIRILTLQIYFIAAVYS